MMQCRIHWAINYSIGIDMELLYTLPAVLAFSGIVLRLVWSPARELDRRLNNQ